MLFFPALFLLFSFSLSVHLFIFLSGHHSINFIFFISLYSLYYFCRLFCIFHLFSNGQPVGHRWPFKTAKEKRKPSICVQHFLDSVNRSLSLFLPLSPPPSFEKKERKNEITLNPSIQIGCSKTIFSFLFSFSFIYDFIFFAVKSFSFFFLLRVLSIMRVLNT